MREAFKAFLADGGLRSRKLWFGILCVVVLASMVFAAAHWAAIAGVYGAFVGGVVSVYAAYTGTNVVNRWGAAKHLGDKLPDDEKVEGDK